jgi:pimeloyl-ACP methyl ester carboxylesterase
VLVINFGGPGDPGSETLPRAFASLPEIIQQRFDVVSFDPRGTGGSDAIDCVDDETFDRGWAEDITPDDADELRAFFDGSAGSVDLVQECVDRFGAWLAHVGTRNVARDVDRLREALGEEQISFLGYSYGTVLGAVYAQEFPDRIRAMVLDSVVDLSASPERELRRTVKGFEASLDEFLALCGASSECPFSKGGDPRAALEQLRDRFEAGLVVPSRDGRTVGVSEFYVAVVAAMYSPASWQYLALGLAAADDDGDGTTLRLLNDLITGRREDGTYNNLQETIGFILCADRFTDRVSFLEYRETFESISADFPTLGPALASQPIGCDDRIEAPTARETLGNVRARPPVPVLIVGLTGDPATPYSGARDLHRRVKRSHLVTVEATQHGGYAQGLGRCLDDLVDAYLVDGDLPPDRAECG